MAALPNIPGVWVGHASDQAARTGCTVIVCPDGAVGGVDVRGAAPGTRETDLLRPGNLVERANAVLLTGGSAFGLAAADGVMRWLHEHGYGFQTAVTPVPIVPAAVLFDLGVGAVTWPDAAQGYAACAAAQSEPLEWGRVGAGTGATVGKILGPAQASAGGIGYASRALPDGAIVAAIVAVNALGHIVDPADGGIVVGARLPDGSYANSVDVLLSPQAPPPAVGENSTIGCVITTARLDKAGCCRVASMAHDGFARAIVPVHTQYDGDTLFALSVAAPDAPAADISLVGIAAAAVVAQAILNAVR